jgi:TPR repeat protein
MENEFNEIAKAAGVGNASAQNKLGECYYYGKGTGANLNEAAKWFQKSAQQGNGDAMFHLSECYHLGDGVGKDDDKAAEWLCKAAQHGSSKAQSEIDNSHRNSEGAMEYKTKAAESYRKAAAEAKAEANAQAQTPASKEAASTQRQTSQDPMLGTYVCERYGDTLVFDSPTHAREISRGVNRNLGTVINREFSVTVNGKKVMLSETANNYSGLSKAQWDECFLPLAEVYKGSFDGKKTVLKGYWHHSDGHTSSHFVFKKVK